MKYKKKTQNKQSKTNAYLRIRVNREYCISSKHYKHTILFLFDIDSNFRRFNNELDYI
jgi:hypothetical protein